MSCLKKYFLLFALNLLPDNFMECLLVPEQKEAVTDCPLNTFSRLLRITVYLPYPYHTHAQAKKPLSNKLFQGTSLHSRGCGGCPFLVF